MMMAMQGKKTKTEQKIPIFNKLKKIKRVHCIKLSIK